MSKDRAFSNGKFAITVECVADLIKELKKLPPDTPVKDGVDGAGYSISLEANVGGNVPMPLDLLDANYTYNVGGMFYEVLGHSISEWNGQRAN